MAFEKLKFAQRVRLKYLDSLLFWESQANRKDLANQFGISEAQAALDFKEYLAAAPKNGLTYDPSLKRYVATPAFEPLSPPSPLTDWLAGAVQSGDGLFDELAPLERQSDPFVEALLYRAARDEMSLQISYQSMTRPKPIRRWITPVHFASDGNRIHVRAYCWKNSDYRDFVIARIDRNSSSFRTRKDADLPDDVEWNTVVKVRLAIHPELTATQARAIRLEYGFEGKYLEVTVRKALLFYVDRQWGLDLERPRLVVHSISPIESTQ